MTRLLYLSATLKSTTSKGAAKMWQIRAVQDDTGCYTTTESWHTLDDGSDSKHVQSAPSYVEVKNAGRANETTLIEQAIAEAQSAEDLKRQKGYRGPGEQKSEKALPMLCHKYEDRKHNLTYPLALQRKMNGVACLMNGETAYSRQGNDFIPGVVEHIIFDTLGYTLHGELVLPEEEFSFQDSMKAIKKIRPESKLLKFIVYDVIEPNITYSERLVLIGRLLKNAPPSVEFLHTWILNDEKQVMERHRAYVQEGAEGSVVKNLNGRYKINARSSDCLKIKDWQDADFEITGVEQGIAKHTNCAIFVCRTAAGKIFNATPKMTIPERQQIWKNRKDYIGRSVEVRFFTLTEDGIPQFPIAIKVRELIE